MMKKRGQQLLTTWKCYNWDISPLQWGIVEHWKWYNWDIPTTIVSSYQRFILNTSMPDVVNVVFYNAMSFNFMWLLPRCGYQLRFLPYNTCKTKAGVFFCCIHRAIYCLDCNPGYKSQKWNVCNVKYLKIKGKLTKSWLNWQNYLLL